MSNGRTDTKTDETIYERAAQPIRQHLKYQRLTSEEQEHLETVLDADEPTSLEEQVRAVKIVAGSMSFPDGGEELLKESVACVEIADRIAGQNDDCTTEELLQQGLSRLSAGQLQQLHDGIDRAVQSSGGASFYNEHRAEIDGFRNAVEAAGQQKQQGGPDRADLKEKQQNGDWEAIIRDVEQNDLQSQYAREVYMVALNKNERFLETLRVARNYIKDNADGQIPDRDLSEIDKHDTDLRNDQMSGEIFAAAGKAFRALGDESAEQKKTALRLFAGVEAAPDDEQTLDRELLELSTELYEAGFFVNREHYPAINAAHNNYRLNNDARAERFGWMALDSMQDQDHAGADYWNTATKLEAALISRDYSQLQETIDSFLQKVDEAEPWMFKVTADTLGDTFGEDFDELDSDTPEVARVTLKLLNALQDGDDEAIELYKKKTREALESMESPELDSGLTDEQKALSERIQNETLDREWRQSVRGLDAIYEQAQQAAPEFFEQLEGLADQTGAELLKPPTTDDNPYGIKGQDRAKDKLEDFAGDTTQLTDILRATFTFENLDSLYETLAELDDSDMTIVDLQDRFLEPKSDGYRDMLLNLEVNGHVAELQLHLEDVVEVKEGPGHELYEQKREIWEQASNEGRQLTKEEEQRVQKLDEQMRSLYNDALS